MPDFARSLGKFLYRDLFYMVAGFIILTSASRLVQLSVAPHTESKTVNTLITAAFAYAVGLLNQELWSQLPFVKTCTYRQYPAFLLGVYRRHMGEEWEYRVTRSKAVSDDPDYQRAINLKQIGSALGTALFTGAALSAAVAMSRREAEPAVEAAIMLVVGSLFLVMSWLHNMRQAAFRAKSRD
ncbi:MAG TPA: hypothetical protein VN231_10805 [Allosphingosinicella sp.]|nr:hypothetical protein [Allosphingosinicella sp.]